MATKLQAQENLKSAKSRLSSKEIEISRLRKQSIFNGVTIKDQFNVGIGGIKTLIICVVSCLVILSAVSVVVAYSSMNWSEPKREDGQSIEWEESNTVIVKGICPREEWNEMFEDYRNGLVTKEDMQEYVRYCK